MKRTLASTLLLSCLIFTLMCRNSAKPESRILVFSKTKGFRHSSIPAGKTALFNLGAANGFVVDTTEDDKVFTEANLKKYQAVVFLSTTGDVLNNEQQAVFEKYIRSGKGFVGIHAATDTEYDWPWYNKLVGGYFESHPKQQEASIAVVDKNHPATRFLPDRWKRFDEWYNFKNLNPAVKVIAKLDESSYEGGKMGANHPIAWYHAYDGGRAFYTACGHTDESYTEPLFLQHVLGGITYAMGKKK